MERIRIGLFTAAALALTPAWAAIPTLHNAQPAPSPFGNATRLSDETLETLRGGFTTTSGLQISFGIERAVYINGDLVTATALNVTAGLAASITADAQQRVASALAESPLQTAAAPATATAVSSATATAVSATAPAAVPAASTMPAAATSSAPVTAATVATSLGTLVSGSNHGNGAATPANTSLQSSASGGLVLVQNGAGNLYQAGALDPNALGTLIQNTLNDQKIQNVTLINATVNSAEVLRAQMMRESLTGAITNSLRR